MIMTNEIGKIGLKSIIVLLIELMRLPNRQLIALKMKFLQDYVGLSQEFLAHVIWVVQDNLDSLTVGLTQQNFPHHAFVPGVGKTDNFPDPPIGELTSVFGFTGLFPAVVFKKPSGAGYEWFLGRRRCSSSGKEDVNLGLVQQISLRLRREEEAAAFAAARPLHLQ
jgi:hypothetical protein